MTLLILCDEATSTNSPLQSASKHLALMLNGLCTFLNNQTEFSCL